MDVSEAILVPSDFDLIPNTAIRCAPGFLLPSHTEAASQSTGTVSMPTSWSYLLGAVGGGPGLIAQTRKWSSDGTFNNANGTIDSELPVDLVDLSAGGPGGGGFGAGVGFGETVSFEPVAHTMRVRWSTWTRSDAGAHTLFPMIPAVRHGSLRWEARGPAGTSSRRACGVRAPTADPAVHRSRGALLPSHAEGAEDAEDAENR